MAKRDWTHQSAPSLTHLMYDHIPYTRPYHLFLVLSTTASFPISILPQVTKSFHISLYFIPYQSFIRRFMQLRTHITQRSLLFLSSIPSIPSSTSFFLKTSSSLFSRPVHVLSFPVSISGLGSYRTVFVLPSPTSSWFSASFWC